MKNALRLNPGVVVSYTKKLSIMVMVISILLLLSSIGVAGSPQSPVATLFYAQPLIFGVLPYVIGLLTLVLALVAPRSNQAYTDHHTFGLMRIALLNLLWPIGAYFIFSALL